jgi:hypothetical protein
MIWHDLMRRILEVDRHDLIRRILEEAALFRQVKFDFPYVTMMNFQPTIEIFDRHNCLSNWAESNWDTTSTTTLYNLYIDLSNNVQIIRAHERECEKGMPWRNEE